MQRPLWRVGWGRIVTMAAGGLTTAIGLAALAEWYTHHTILVQLLPTFTSIQYGVALGFILGGAGLFALGFRQPRSATLDPAPRIPVLVGLIVAAITLYLWQALSTHGDTLIERMVTIAARETKAKIEDAITQHILPLEQMARRWEWLGQPSQDEWIADAALHVQQSPALQAIAWTDTSWHIRWIAPLAGNAALQGQSLEATERQRQALELAQRLYTTTVTHVLGAKGGNSFHAYIPIVHAGRISGILVGILRIHLLLDTALQDLAPGFTVTIFDGEEKLYSRGPAGPPHTDTWSREVSVILPGVTWRLQLLPTRERLAEERSALPEVVLTLGLLTSVLLASLISLAQTSRQRAGQLAENLQQMDTVRTVNTEIARELELTDLLDLIIQRAVTLVPAASSGLVLLWDETVQLLIPRIWHNYGEWVHEVRLQLGEGLAGTVAQRREGFMVDNYQISPHADPRFVANFGTAAVVAEPLVYRDQLVGVIELDNHETSLPFTEQDRSLLTLLATQAAIAIANAQLFAEVQEHTAALVQANMALQREIIERKHVEDALRVSQQFLQSTLDALPAHIAILDQSGTILAVNTAWRRFADTIGFQNPAYGVGMNYLEVCRETTGGDAAATQAIVTGIEAVLKQQRDACFHEYACPSPEAPRWFLMRVAQFESPEGKRIVVVHENITELKQAEAQLQHQQEALYQREKLAAMGSLLASVAHELNNPLSVIMMQADLLREEAKGVELAEQTAAIGQSAERCMHIVRNFLALARQSPPQRTAVDLNAVIAEAMGLLAYALHVDNIDVQQHLDPALPHLRADPHQLHQVVVNLVTNAHQALCETSGPRQLTLTTRFDMAQSRVVFAVADTGPGMPPEVQARIFEPFFTTKLPGVGTGLGLPLCQGIIESHGGSMTVESQPGHGVVFCVELPAETLPVAVSDTPEVETHIPLEEQERAILVVDDEDGIAKALAYLLRRDGHHVDTAANGRLGVDKLQERPYDLILCDLRMPELDGPGLYQEVAAQFPHLLPRFVFLTGDTLSPEVEAFFQQVEVPRLRKPFRATEVRRAVRQALHVLQEQ